MDYFTKCISSNHWDLLSSNIDHTFLLDSMENYFHLNFNLSFLLEKSLMYKGTTYNVNKQATEKSSEVLTCTRACMSNRGGRHLKKHQHIQVH